MGYRLGGRLLRGGVMLMKRRRMRMGCRSGKSFGGWRLVG